MAIAVEELDDVLEWAWRTICEAYDVSADLPDMHALFGGADLTAPAAAAEMVLVNMLAEAVESISRFSPWYRMPARAFGMIQMRDRTTERTRWLLAPEAAQRWESVLKRLAEAIQRNMVLLQATRVVDDLMRQIPPDDPCVMACCVCEPKRVILINRSVLRRGEVICSGCHHPFLPLDEADMR